VVLPLARAAAVSTGLRVRPHKLAPRRRAHVEEGRHWSGLGLGLGLGSGLGLGLGLGLGFGLGLGLGLGFGLGLGSLTLALTLTWCARGAAAKVRAAGAQ